MSLDLLISALGPAAGRHLHALANGIDDRAVEPERQTKSIGHEETFPRDHRSHRTLERELVRLGDSVAARLRAHGLAGRTITLKVRFHDFRTITRSTTLAGATDSSQAIVGAAKELLSALDPSPGVRLIGVSVSGLAEGGTRQLTLDDLTGGSWEDANEVVDAIRARFGSRSIGPAALAGPGGLHLRLDDDKPWGPDGPTDDQPGQEG
jgi:DNA polymerase-4